MADNFIASAFQDAIAANHASDMLGDKKVGTIRKAVDFVADTAGDALNVATLGASRRVANVFADKDKKLDYKGLKQAKKDAREAEDDLDIRERAERLAARGSPPSPSQDGPEDDDAGMDGL